MKTLTFLEGFLIPYLVKLPIRRIFLLLWPCEMVSDCTSSMQACGFDSRQGY
jgi:hypothetical protein